MHFFYFSGIGDIKFIRLWHDNTGEGDDGSWFCHYVLVVDLQTQKRSLFLVNQWFAAEESDGRVTAIFLILLLVKCF